MSTRGKIAAAGLAGSLGLAGIVQADGAKFDYSKTNLAQYGIPNVFAMGLEPYQTKWFDHTSKVPGKESRMDFYRLSDRVVYTYSIDGKVYGAGYDKDMKPPLDLALYDPDGSGNFEKKDPQSSVIVADWVTR